MPNHCELVYCGVYCSDGLLALACFAANHHLAVYMSEPSSKATETRNRFRSASPAILPSLLMCDFSNLEREVRQLEEAGIAVLHLDVMDGHFVPNLTYGMPIVEALRRVTDLALDVHLMISDPSQYAHAFIEAGADAITFHIEAESNPEGLLRSIQSHGVLAGLAINPQTGWETVTPFVEFCDLFLVMSVQAGFGGQAFNPIALERLSQLHDQYGDRLLLEVDGGVNEKTIGSCVAAGADLLVVGSALFKQPDYCQAITRLQAAYSP
ncbi:ribulose-phosphate 3-epimerase [Pirellula sp. SH-Sr6A]|uniref:ribulose-phosphate 3-epimerase n=1 Tax=Pirellula sp. SH-Sr6A TaxID=1632865 RepID=UPI001F0A6760|nr:ribulose-phosphate 3-epimerase [Pirellula sp. SH-Sr6A]